MLATPGPLPSGPGWAYEFKWDGVRALATIERGRLRLHARSGAEITAAYPELAALAGVLDHAVLDGEIVVLDAAGRPSFTALAERMHVREKGRAQRLAASLPVTYMIFDLLELDGLDLTSEPYQRRREGLEALHLPDRHWLVPPWFDDGAATLSAAAERKSTRLNSSHVESSYAVFCLKKKKNRKSGWTAGLQAKKRPRADHWYRGP